MWEEQGRLSTRSAELELAGIVPLAGAAADPDLTPEYPGITESEHVSDWDPPFPIDLSLVRPRDEEYWERHRTTPKAFVPLADGQALWSHRLGRLTSVRLRPAAGEDLEATRAAVASELVAALNPMRRGFSVEAARAEGLQASRGATDFSEYFVYFSFFLIVSALLLAGLFFRLGVEQRIQQLGLLRAIGFSPGQLRTLFLGEGLVLASFGSLAGIAGAVGYGGLMVLGLRTLWVDAMGTQRLSLEVSAASLLIGAVAGVVAGLLTIVWTLRSLRRISPRGLLAGELGDVSSRAARGRRAHVLAAAAFAGSLLLLVGAATGLLGQVPGFFGSGTLLLVAALAYQWLALCAAGRRRSAEAPRLGVVWLGLRGASHRPGRSLLSIALIAFATFVIVSVGAFRREGDHVSLDARSGTGGYALLARSLLPLHHDPNTAAGREALNLGGEDGSVLERVRFARFRLRPGEDASCLNLYRPAAPAILAPTDAFLRERRFAFAGSLAETAEERANPWLLLGRTGPEGSIPVIGDANSMAYALHRKLGEQLVLERPGASPVRLWFVAALRDSVFQGELLMAESHFLRAFPEQDGYRFFLLETPPELATHVAGLLESRLGDLGFDVQPTAERLAGFHRVENTYLSTFQTLGGLGLLLGTIGLATVLVRNALERRRELALLRAVGYRRRHLSLMLMAENGLLLVSGLATGTFTALVAIAPALAARGSPLPAQGILVLLLGVLLLGLAVSRLAVALIQRLPLLATLRAE